MSKRSKSREAAAAAARHPVGDRVWVRHGVTNTSIPTCRWGAGRARLPRSAAGGMYTVHWDHETLDRRPPGPREGAVRTGTGWTWRNVGWRRTTWSPIRGGPPCIEQPLEIVPRPLSKENQDDRVRMVFGLSSDDLLPEANEESLETYYAYLKGRL